MRVLVIGFEPFDGRQQNASWLAARALAAESHASLQLRALQLPVCWGEPWPHLEQALRDWPADSIIAMGEGRPGAFRLETRARNLRKEREDNRGELPHSLLIAPDGPAEYRASADCGRLQAALAAEGIPLELSADAGAFLCEELLYTLETFRQQRADLQSVLFVHVPPYGTALTYKGRAAHCDEALLLDFGRSLLGKVHPH